MAYLFLALVLLSGATKGYCGKKTSGYVKTVQDSFRQNLLRMTLCVAISALLLLARGNISALAVTPAALLPALCAYFGLAAAEKVNFLNLLAGTPLFLQSAEASLFGNGYAMLVLWLTVAVAAVTAMLLPAKRMFVK